MTEPLLYIIPDLEPNMRLVRKRHRAWLRSAEGLANPKSLRAFVRHVPGALYLVSASRPTATLERVLRGRPAPGPTP